MSEIGRKPHSTKPYSTNLSDIESSRHVTSSDRGQADQWLYCVVTVQRKMKAYKKF